MSLCSQMWWAVQKGLFLWWTPCGGSSSASCVGRGVGGWQRIWLCPTLTSLCLRKITREMDVSVLLGQILTGQWRTWK